MKKTTQDQPEQVTFGENTVLMLTVPVATHKPAYAQVLAKVSGRVTLPGFRKGKAPKKLVEENISASALLDETLQAVLPDIYAAAVDQAGISPLVAPQLQIVSVEPDKDWVLEAHTAVAPVIELGDWEKTVKDAGKNFFAEAKKKAKDEKKEEAKADDEEQELLSAIFAKLIEATKPKIAPLLVDQEVRRQIQEFARHLASHRIELDQYLASTGTTVEKLQQDHTVASLANLQVEFILQALTNAVKPMVEPADIEEVMGKDLSKYSKEALERVRHDAHHLVQRRKTVEKIKEIAKS